MKLRWSREAVLALGRLDGTREVVVADTPFTFVYQVAADALTILAVVHRARDRA